MTYTKLHDIKARVTARWKHPRCKFQRGDTAQVNEYVLPEKFTGSDSVTRTRPSYVSKVKQRRVGRYGTVVAVSCLPSGRIRSNYYRNNESTRMFTRYYIQFADGVIMGYDSHHLDHGVINK